MLSEEELIQIRNYNFDCLKDKSSDYQTMLAAVKANPFALQSASADLKANREIVLEAVKQNGYALRFASSGLKADREVVLEAVKKSRHALSHASDRLRGDREIAIMAMISYPDAFIYCSDDAKDDPDLKLLNNFFKYVYSSGQKQLSVTLIAHLLKQSGNDRDQVLRVLRAVRTLLEKQYEIKSYKDELIKQETLGSRVKLLLKISHPYSVSVVLDASDYMAIYSDENQDKPTVSSDIFDSYSSLMLCIGEVKGSPLKEQEFIKILNATCLQSDISLLTRLFWGNNIFQEFMDEKKLWRQIDQKYVSLIEDLSSSNVSMLVDWRIVHLLHVFGGIEGTEIAQAFIHTQSLINCLNETGNGEIAEKFSTDCFDTGYIGHYFCLMVTSDSEGNKTIKNLDDLEAGDTITILDRGASIFEADYRQASYTVGADVEKTKSFFKSCTGKEVNSVKKELKALVDSKALSQQAYMTSSELGGFDPTKRYGGKRMKKGICTMNQKLFIREALTLKHGPEEGFQKYKEFSTILRMRAFDKIYLQSDASLFLEDEIAMVKNIIGRVRKGYITEEFIASSESVSPIMKASWVKLIQEEYDDSQILLMIRLIKKNRELFPGAALSREDLEDRVSEESYNREESLQNGCFSQIEKNKVNQYPLAAYLKYDQITSGQDRDILEKQFDLLKRVSENPEAILAMINDHKTGEKEGDAAVMECHSKDMVLTLVNKRFNTLFSNLCKKIGANLPETDSDISQYDSFLQLSDAVKAIKDGGDYDGKSLSP